MAMSKFIKQDSQLAVLVMLGALLSQGCSGKPATATVKSPATPIAKSPTAKSPLGAPTSKPAVAPPASVSLKLPDGTSLVAGQPFVKERMVCPKKGPARSAASCACLAPYVCKGASCTFDGELRFIRDKLRTKAWVAFKYAEYGSCDDHHYIYMDKGETLGTILVFYGPKGRKIALERTSDYNEFCHGRALHAFFGQLPPCRTMRRQGVLSPNPKGRTPRSAFESLSRLSRP